MIFGTSTEHRTRWRESTVQRSAAQAKWRTVTLISCPCDNRRLAATFYNMSDWDTAPITLRKRTPKASTLKTEKAVNDARRQGFTVETQAKWGGGANRQHVTTKNTAKLDRETEELKHDKIPLDLGKLIQQGRQSKGLSQKDLATKVNEKAQVINDYEAGRGIPNQMVIGKIERVLGVKLRGKDRGKPLTTPGTKK